MVEKQDLRLFISYRRDESAGHAGRFYDSTLQFVDESQIFKDIDNIAAGRV